MDGQELYDEEQLLAMRSEYISGIERMGVQDKINSTSRFYQAFKLIEEWSQVVSAKGSLDELLARYPHKELHFALQEATEMVRILPQLDATDSIARDKLILASSGVLNPLSEIDSAARNAQFELALYSDLRRSGYDARLCDPNPDIQVHLNGSVYNIECKRVLSPKKVESNYSKASSQLRKFLAQSPENHYGVAALSVLSSITDRAAHIDALPFEAFQVSIGQNFQEFVNKNSHIWTKSSRLMGGRIPAVILHMLITVMDQSVSPPERHLVNNYAFTPTRDDQQMYDRFLEDMGKLHG